MPALLWFRRDLRLGDLPPLLNAVANTEEVLACFVLDPRLEASSGGARMQFLCDSLRQLHDELDGRLLVTRGRPEERIPAIAKEVDAQSVHVSEDFAPFGRRRDDRVREALGDVPLVATGSPYLISPGRVTKDNGDPYKVFTPFFGRWRELGWRKPARTGPKSGRWVDTAQLGKATKPVEIPDPGVELDLGGGEAAARRQWKAFLHDGLDKYSDDRNRPDRESTSRMSAHLKFGTIHPRTMVADLDQHRAGPRAYLRAVGISRFLRRGSASLAGKRPGGIGTATSTPSKPTPERTPSGASRHGKPAKPDSRSSTPVCVN